MIASEMGLPASSLSHTCVCQSYYRIDLYEWWFPLKRICGFLSPDSKDMEAIISLDFDHPVSYYTRKKVTYELVTHEYNKLEVGE